MRDDVPGQPRSGDLAPADVLFSTLSINELKLANRIVMSPMSVLPITDGRPNALTNAFLSERATGGVGLIILGSGMSTRRAFEEVAFKGATRLDDDRFLPGLTRLTDAVHEHGTPIFAELIPGFGAMGKAARGRPLIAASATSVVMKANRYPQGIIVPFDRATPVPREATLDEIGQAERDTAAAAERARRAGFDGVEIGAHMNYFLASFLSPRSNSRTDEYGGSLENRARILVNIVRLVRQQVGPNYPVGLRICSNEHVDGGQDAAGYAAIAALVEREGVDYVALSDGTYESLDMSSSVKDAATVGQDAQVFRQAVSCPLIVGGVHSPDHAAQVIAAGHADAVMFARSLLADPQYANKVREGRATDIVACDGHNQCLARQAMGMPVRCTVNPRMGREDRRPGQLPPIGRFLAAPAERAVLAATGSQTLMNLAAKLIRKGQ
jgi:2,4-dienoyl-CoA reductase (NADPH2)